MIDWREISHSKPVKSDLYMDFIINRIWPLNSNTDKLAVKNVNIKKKKKRPAQDTWLDNQQSLFKDKLIQVFIGSLPQHFIDVLLVICMLHCSN